MRILEKQHIDRSQIIVTDLHSDSDVNFWRHRTPLERLHGLEILRQMWNDYDPDTARLPRFYTVIEQK